MPDQVNLALVGCGAVCDFHCPALEAPGSRLKVTAAVDTDPQRAQRVADRFGAAVFADLDDALARGDFDAVDIMLPHDLHETAAMAVFRAGRHLLLEKPIAANVAAAHRILEAGRAADCVFMVGENAQYWPEVVEAKRLIDTGAIGTPFTAQANMSNPFDPFWYSGAQPWRFDRNRAGGGIVIDGGSHWIRPLRMWMGEIDRVVAVTRQPLAQMEGESLAHALLQFAGGSVGRFDAMTVDSVIGPDEWFRVTGSEGQLTIGGNPKGRLRRYDANHPEGTIACEAEGYAGSFMHEMADFAAAILDGSPLAAGPEQALGELLFALAVYRSAQSGQWETVGRGNG